MKNFTKLIGLVALLGFGASANAALYQTSKYFDGDHINHTFTPGDSVYNGSFNIVGGPGSDPWDRVGFDPFGEIISDLEIIFAFRNADNAQDLLTIGVGKASENPFGTFYNTPTVILGENVGLTFTGSIFGGDVLVELQNTGTLDYSISYSGQQEDLKLAVGILAVDTVSVPDSGSLGGLMGLAIFGLIAVKRRLR